MTTDGLVGEDAAEAAGLSYVDDAQPGYARRRHGRGFSYLDHRGRTVTDRAVVERLRGLVVPPAWTDVWLCTDPLGHIQATGRDARGRKQYRYHDDWQRIRDEAKFDSLFEFGHALPSLRQRVDADMRQHNLSFERVVATTVWLLDHTLIRIGNDEYARSDHSYGITTLRNRHVDVTPNTLRFRFTGKSGKPHDVVLHDRRVARTIARCQELPGQQLFQYVDDESVHGVDSRDVNSYIREVTSTEFTAKTFRTWGGSVLTCQLLRLAGAPASASEATQQVRDAVKATATELRNTPTVCRRSYIHPLVLESYADGRLNNLPTKRRSAKAAKWLTNEEADLLVLLEARD